MKGPTGKTFEGVYANAQFIHSFTSLVGCIVQVQVKCGSVYEGVFRTFSQKVDFVLEMAHRIHQKGKKMASNDILPVLPKPEDITEKMIFRIEDVVMLSAINIDLDFATRDHFTDTAISKFNGQVLERELEPWDDGPLTGDVADLGTDGEEANGWDPNDMFRTNEEKYGVKSSFDSTLHGYTIPLKRQDTEEYKQQEAKASKIAQEIESGFHYKNRLALENGDEEDRFSAVVRPDNTNNNNNNNNRFITHRPRRSQGLRTVRNNQPAYQNNRISHPQTQTYHKSPSPSLVNNNSQSNCKTTSSASSPTCASTPSPRPTPSSTPTPRQVPPLHLNLSNQQVPQYQTPLAPSDVRNTTPPLKVAPVQSSKDQQINGESEVKETRVETFSHPSSNEQNQTPPTDINCNLSSRKTKEHVKENEKKTFAQKVHDEKTEDLKRFHEKFKLSESKEMKQNKDVQQKQVEVSSEKHESSKVVDKPAEEEKEKSEELNSPETTKLSSLNPNAKKFELNPNAETFTPRSLPVPNAVVPQPVQQPPRLHTQSPVMAMPQPLMPSVAQPIFANVAPHYLVQATPVSVPMAPPYTPATSMAQAPRYRKKQEYALEMGVNQYEDVIFSAMPITFQRHDMPQSVHVQAATGQPILAPPTLSTPQFAIQYAPSPGILHPQGPQGPSQLTYTQMYSVMGPRVLTPQPVGMVSTPVSYGENSHMPTHLYMTHPANANIQHAVPSGNAGQHSTPSTPQSQTPSLHPAPSPVHPPLPSTPHGQTPTPNGHNSNPPTPQVLYHGHLTSQHPLHANSVANSQNHPYPGSYTGTPQPIMLLPQQPVQGGPHMPHPSAFPGALTSHPLHGQTPGSHAGTPTHVLPHPPMAMMPTSAAMVHNQPAMSGGPYAPQSQA